MKKLILLLFVFATLIGCSDDNTENPNKTENYFNPPSWIQGEWGLDLGDGQIMPQMKFTNDDFIILIGDGSTFSQGVSYKELLSNMSYGKKPTVKEVVSATKYYFKINLSASVSLPTTYNLEFRLEKIGADKLFWVNNPASTIEKVYLVRIR